MELVPRRNFVKLRLGTVLGKAVSCVKLVGSKVWNPGEDQNSWYMDVHPKKTCRGLDPP